MPSSVLMDVNKEIQFEPNSNGVAAAILVLLAYPKNNSVIIFYYGADLQTNKFISCSKANTVQLFIYDDGTPLASYESLVNVPDVHRLRVTGWKKLEDVTNLTIDSFFYQSTEHLCLLALIRRLMIGKYLSYHLYIAFRKGNVMCSATVYPSKILYQFKRSQVRRFPLQSCSTH